AAEKRRRALYMLEVRGTPEAQPPCREIHGWPRLDVEGRSRVPHPLEGERHHAGRGERHEMARHHHAGVAVGAAVAALAVALEHRDAHAALGAVIRGAQADDPAADDRDLLNGSPSKTGR